MTEHDKTKLIGVHPTLVAAVEKVFAAMAILGYTMMVTDGVRTEAEQRALYAKGRTAPGPIVTNADGTMKRSNHQAYADSWGHAVDATFVVNGVPSWDMRLPWKAYGACAEALGLKWGGSFVNLHDFPHVELP